MYGWCGRSKIVVTSAASTTLPAYITTTSSAISAMTPRSWVMSMMAIRLRSRRRLHQLQDLGLDRDVECGGGLVGDEQLGVGGQGHGDHDPLAHPARELVRILAGPAPGVGDPDLAQHLDGSVPRLAPRDSLVQRDRLGDLVAARVDRVQRGHRLLEDHRDRVPAHVPHLLVGHREKVAAREPDRALDDPAGPLDEPHDRERRDALAAARTRRRCPGSRRCGSRS